MTDSNVKARRSEISALWGLSSVDIDDKLGSLKSIIPDEPDDVLLGLLLKCDLDIEGAVGKYYDEESSSFPPPINDENHNSNVRVQDNNSHRKRSREEME